MDYQLLKRLCFTHAVTGDTKLIRQLITLELDNRKIKYSVNGFGSIVFGNTNNPKKMFVAHMDEVGFQISNIEQNGKIRILPMGWVFANRLDHNIVYIQTDGEMLPGLVLHEESLKVENIQSMTSLYIDIGCDSDEAVIKKGVRQGMTGSFQKEFYEFENSIIASSLDNKISIYTILTLIDANPEIMKENLFAFNCDEEMQDHSANGLGHQYHAPMVIVLDYCPIHQKTMNGDVLGKSGDGAMVMYRGGYYVLHQDLRKYFDTKIKTTFQKGFLASETLPTLEPANYEDNGTTKAVNVCIQAYGYHGAAYSVRKKDIENYHNLLTEILKTDL